VTVSNSNETFERTDAELIELIQRGGRSDEGAQEAAEVLFSRYRRKVYLLCFRYLSSHEAALDASQEVLLRAYEGLREFRGRSQFAGWLFAITRNHCLNVLRSRRPTLGLEEIGHLADDPRGGPEEAAERSQRQERLLAAMRAALDPLEQKALWLRYGELLPVEQITDLLELSGKSGARAVLQRARRKLKRALEAAGEE